MQRALLALLLLVSACTQEQISNVERDFVIAGRAGHGVQNARQNALGGALEQHELRLLDSAGKPSDVVKILIEVGAGDVIKSASLRWEGPFGRRYVELTQTPDGSYQARSRGNDETITISAGPLQLRERLQPGQAITARTLELATLQGPAVPVESVQSQVVTAAHRAPAPFLESTAPVVARWCKQQSAERDPLKAAAQIVGALGPKLDKEKRRGPPSALAMVERGGWDESASALLVACLRTLGHAARVVSSAEQEGVTWAQVHDQTRFVDVDPLARETLPAAAWVGFHPAVPAPAP